jgi:hypothetical protein
MPSVINIFNYTHPHPFSLDLDERLLIGDGSGIMAIDLLIGEEGMKWSTQNLSS